MQLTVILAANITHVILGSDPFVQSLKCLYCVWVEQNICVYNDFLYVCIHVCMYLCNSATWTHWIDLDNKNTHRQSKMFYEPVSKQLEL